MRQDSIILEEERVGGLNSIEDYPSFHERHRIFPEVFEGRNHKIAIDIAAGVGVVGKRIMDYSNVHIVCNDMSPTCLKVMKSEGIDTVSFDIDDESSPFPYPDCHFDAVISLASIEHIIHIDHYMREIHRIISKNGYLYISSPNYAGILYLLPFLISGRSFHNPLIEKDRYEFYAHVRYFTYKTLFEYVGSFGFIPDAIYLPIPKDGSRYLELRKKSKLTALIFRSLMKYIYIFFGPRWSSEPVICFQKNFGQNINLSKKVL